MMHVTMMHVLLLLLLPLKIWSNFVTNERPNGRTNKAILGVGCIYLASYTIDVIHVYMMHVSMMHVYITLIHEHMMHVSIRRSLDPDVCMNV